MVHPLTQPAGQAGKRRQVFVPVSNAMTGGMSALGALSVDEAYLAACVIDALHGLPVILRLGPETTCSCRVTR